MFEKITAILIGALVAATCAQQGDADELLLKLSLIHI